MAIILLELIFDQSDLCTANVNGRGKKDTKKLNSLKIRYIIDIATHHFGNTDPKSTETAIKKAINRKCRDLRRLIEAN